MEESEEEKYTYYIPVGKKSDDDMMNFIFRGG